MLSDEATPRTKGKIFGFHRSMDTLGAVLGPQPYSTSTSILSTTYFTLRSFLDFCYSRYPFVKRKKRTVPREGSNPYSRFWLLKVSPPMYRYRSLAFHLI
jgi:hypothetical protein